MPSSEVALPPMDRAEEISVVSLVSLANVERAAVHLPAARSPFDASRGAHAPGNDAHAQSPSAVPDVVRRVAVYGVKRERDAATAQGYGVFLYDTDDREHALLRFEDAASATYAALRFGQMYRVGVEFGNFSDPKALRSLRD
ncbi:MAG: hypothetical protein ACTHKH_23360 [Trinickia sp.]|jgi:hypothetical protein